LWTDVWALDCRAFVFGGRGFRSCAFCQRGDHAWASNWRSRSRSYSAVVSWGRQPRHSANVTTRCQLTNSSCRSAKVFSADSSSTRTGSARPQGFGLALEFVQLPVVGQRLVAAQRVAAARLVELAPRMGVAGHFDDGRAAGSRVRQVERVVAAEGIGVQVAAIVFQQLLRPVAFPIGG